MTLEKQVHSLEVRVHKLERHIQTKYEYYSKPKKIHPKHQRNNKYIR